MGVGLGFRVYGLGFRVRVKVKVLGFGLAGWVRVSVRV